MTSVLRAALVPAQQQRIGVDLLPKTEDGPVLEYDLVRAHQQVSAFRAAFRDRVAVRYAVKCNPDPRLLRTVLAAGGGFEIASLAELQRATQAGARPADVLYSNPVKPPAHVAGAAARGVGLFAVDSLEELTKLAEHAPGAGVYVRLRVDDAGSQFPLSSKFGTSHDDAHRLLRSAEVMGLQPAGVTFHVGSQCTDVDAWARAVRGCGPLLRGLLDDGVRLDLLNIGGGFPAQYDDGTPVPALQDIASRVLAALDTLPYVPQQLFCEPGRAIAAQAAVLVATVIGRAERDGRRWLYTDVGAYNGLMEAAQTGGRLAFPVSTTRAHDPDRPAVRCTITGPSCDSSDTLLLDVALPEDVQVGDRLRIGAAGAYSVCYAAPFNGFPIPRAVYLG